MIVVCLIKNICTLVNLVDDYKKLINVSETLNFTILLQHTHSYASIKVKRQKTLKQKSTKKTQ